MIEWGKSLATDIEYQCEYETCLKSIDGTNCYGNGKQTLMSSHLDIDANITRSA